MKKKKKNKEKSFRVFKKKQNVRSEPQDMKGSDYKIYADHKRSNRKKFKRHSIQY